MSGRILIVDDVPTNRVILKAKLSNAYFDVLATDDAVNAHDLIKKEQPDLVLLDVMMPGKDGFQLCEELKADRETAHIPVVMVTALDTTEERIKGLEAGADDFVSKPFDDYALIARLRNLMRFKLMFDEMRLRDDTSRELGLHEFLEASPTPPEFGGKILIAGSDFKECTLWSNILREHLDADVYVADGEASTMLIAEQQKPDIFIVHEKLMDDADGLRLLSALRSNRDTRRSSTIFVMDRDDVEMGAAALDLGANDYIKLPFDANELVVRVKSQLRRKRYTDRLRSNVIDGLKMAVIDPLTGLYNRRYAMQHTQTIAARADEHDAQFSVLMMDLDEFKRVNDQHGHSAGDEVLSEFARRVQENVRGIDLVARLGGEEFCVVMPDTGTEQAAYVAERLREAIETRPFKLRSTNASVDVTVSIGVAASSDSAQEADLVMRQADQALYNAKSGGRNLVKVASEAA